MIRNPNNPSTPPSSHNQARLNLFRETLTNFNIK
jgi:hypothetical protein